MIVPIPRSISRSTAGEIEDGSRAERAFFRTSHNHPEKLPDAIDELLSSSFHGAELSLLTSEHVVEETGGMSCRLLRKSSIIFISAA
jgi:hypothetical protein